MRLKNYLKKEIMMILNEIFLGVYPSEKINKSITLEKMTPGKKIPFPDFKHGQKQSRQDTLVVSNEHFTKK